MPAGQVTRSGKCGASRAGNLPALHSGERAGPVSEGPGSVCPMPHRDPQLIWITMSVWYTYLDRGNGPRRKGCEMASYRAEFPLVRHAVSFADRLVTGHYWAKDVVRSGRVVEFEYDAATAVKEAGHDVPENQWALDMLELVGYVGSAPQGRKAKLNGRTAPATW